jgi:hypothetical protein
VPYTKNEMAVKIMRRVFKFSTIVPLEFGAYISYSRHEKACVRHDENNRSLITTKAFALSFGKTCRSQ